MQSTVQHAFAHTHTHSVLSHQLDVSVATGDSHDFVKLTDPHQLSVPIHIRRHLGSQLALAGS